MTTTESIAVSGIMMGRRFGRLLAVREFGIHGQRWFAAAVHFDGDPAPVELRLGDTEFDRSSAPGSRVAVSFTLGVATRLEPAAE